MASTRVKLETSRRLTDLGDDQDWRLDLDCGFRAFRFYFEDTAELHVQLTDAVVDRGLPHSVAGDALQFADAWLGSHVQFETERDSSDRRVKGQLQVGRSPAPVGVEPRNSLYRGDAAFVVSCALIAAPWVAIWIWAKGLLG